MKKIVLLFAFVSICLGVSAQDTIFSALLSPSYFCNQCPPEEKEYEVLKATPTVPNGDICPFFAKRFYTTDTLTVYGVAAAYMFVREQWPFANETLYDTTWDNAYEYFSLCRDAVGADSLVCFSDSVMIHATNTPIAYYQTFTTEGLLGSYYPAVYEAYFDTSYQIQGRFYIAMSQRSNFGMGYYDSVTNQRYDAESNYVNLCKLAITNRETGAHRDDTITTRVHHEGGWDPLFQVWDPDTDVWITVVYGNMWMFFPIVDTSGIGYGSDSSDVLANWEPMANRFVVISPNPVKGKVQVTASCGMSRLTVYDPSGKAVLEKEVYGGSETLDVTGWPAGCYIVHVNTHLGPAMKKLLVQ